MENHLVGSCYISNEVVNNYDNKKLTSNACQAEVEDELFLDNIQNINATTK